jgi:hypothetical protein
VCGVVDIGISMMTSIDSMTSKSMLSDAAGGWQTGTTGLIAGTFPDFHE